MIPQCPRCGKDDFKKMRDRIAHLKRKNPCRKRNQPPRSPTTNVRQPAPLPSTPPVLILHEPQVEANVPETSGQRNETLSLEDLANWLSNPEIKNNPSIISKKIPQTDVE